MTMLSCAARVEENSRLSISEEILKEMGIKIGDELIVNLHPLTPPREKKKKSKGGERLSVMGKYAGIIGSSEEFMNRKREEIALEERREK